MTSHGKTLIYLGGIAGTPQLSPAVQALAEGGWTVVVPSLPGFNGQSGFRPPSNYMDWLAIVWDALDSYGVGPCPFVGASVGGMLAAEVAIFRPEMVTALALIDPFGIADDAHPGFDYFAVPSAERLPHAFSKGVPEAFLNRFNELGPEEAPVARYLSDMAAANLVWPLGDRGLRHRIHRLPSSRVILHGELDELIPVSTARLWGDVTILPGAGHLAEWDTPDLVSHHLGVLLNSLG